MASSQWLDATACLQTHLHHALDALQGLARRRLTIRYSHTRVWVGRWREGTLCPLLRSANHTTRPYPRDRRRRALSDISLPTSGTQSWAGESRARTSFALLCRGRQVRTAHLTRGMPV